MKKYLSVYILIMGFWVTLSGSLYAQKIGFTNSAAILAAMPETQEADRILKALEQDMQAQGQSMTDALQGRMEEYLKMAEQGTLTRIQINQQEENLKKDRAKITEFEKNALDLLTKKREELYTPILDKVNRIIGEVARQHGFQMILDISALNVVLYAEDYLDVTHLIKDSLGI